MPKVLNAVFGNWKVSGDPHLRFRHAAVDQLRPELLRRRQQCPLQLRARRHHGPDPAHQPQLDLEPRQHRHHRPRTNSVSQSGGLRPAGEYDLRRHAAPDVVPAPAVDRQRRSGDPEELRDSRKGQPGSPRFGVERSEPGGVRRSEHHPEQRRFRPDHRHRATARAPSNSAPGSRSRQPATERNRP